MHSMQIITQTYQIGYHLHMMPCSTLPGILNGVNDHKATGPDEVLARLLKEAADQFAPIFWVFYRQSIVLVEWRTANVIQIFKKVNHASSDQCLWHQFAPKLWNIISVPRSWDKQVQDPARCNLPDATDAILLDFARRLINSPINVSCWNSLRICIDGCTFGWIRSFLYDWDKTVGLEGKSSSTKPVTSGITHKELCSDRCCSLCRTTICLNEYSHHTPDYSQMTASL